ncbi:hypothetical protein HNQ10_002574 [Deinococcus metallilatus]|uniref:Uncharacterized protein n=1 Tax=Deinococcus metallilatus TaxID=1211322 RepID=A0ABR6MWH8_9DEIO|nr:hypothetical protein [Deinococcus metallilatus]
MNPAPVFTVRDSDVPGMVRASGRTNTNHALEAQVSHALKEGRRLEAAVR